MTACGKRTDRPDHPLNGKRETTIKLDTYLVRLHGSPIEGVQAAPALSARISYEKREVKMKGKTLYLIVALTLFMVAATQIGLAQADLTAIERITVKIDGNDEDITIIQDYSKKQQWYYIPNRPRLVERKLRGKTMPVFNLVRYQFRKGQAFDEGGIMQFEINFALPGSAIDSIKSRIAGKLTTAQKTVSPNDINLVSLPLNNAHFYLYSPGGEKMMVSDTPTEGLAPTFATQNIPFSLSLTEEGGAVFDTVVRDTLGGVPVIAVMEFTGLTAPAGFRCEVNWDVTYRRLESDTKLSAALSGVPYVTPGVSGGYSNLRARLEKAGCIKLEVIEGSNFNLEDADRYLQPILTIMAREMLENPAAPSSIPTPVVQKKNPLVDVVKALQPSAQNTVAGTPAAASGGAGLPSVSINLSFTMKDEKLVRKGKQTYEMNVRRAMTQTTVCGGFIGIGQYPKSIQDEVVLVVPDTWEKAYLSLPRITQDDDTNIEEVTLTAGLNDGSKNYDQQVATWTPERGWTGPGYRGGDEEMQRFAFATMALKAAMGDKWQDAYFKLDSSISYKPSLLSKALRYEGSTTVKLFSGNAPVSSPLDMTDLWLFDASYLLFKDDDPSSTLQRVDILVSSDKLRASVRASIDPSRNDARMLPVLIDRDASQVKASISFVTTDRRTVRWEYNGKNLKEIPDYQGGMVFLSDWDWME
jgi:hypothetical protein